MSNDNNYTGIHLDNIVGVAGGPKTVRNFDNGGSQAELSVAVSQGYKNKQTQEWVDTGTAWIRVKATGDYADQNWPEVGKGDKVRINGGRLETREFDRADGTKGQSFELVYGEVQILVAKNAPAEVEAPF
jgi:single-strand DNA-binding protein